MQFMLAAGLLSAILGLTAFSILLDLHKNAEIVGLREPVGVIAESEISGAETSTPVRRIGPQGAPAGFRGPSGEPYVIGPSGPPPNY